jgi:hypothetical protein
VVEHGTALGLGLTFDWSILEVVAEVIARGEAPSEGLHPLVVAVSSEKSEAEIPASRRELLDELLSSRHMEVVRIPPGWRSGAILRTEQARLGDVLVVLGGGAGVEHLAELYALRRRPIVPLDFRLGSSRGDGLIGGEGLAKQARTSPSRFLTLKSAHNAGARLASLSTTNGADAGIIARGLVQLVSDLALPKAFFVRLLNRDHESFAAVEDFFRMIVDKQVTDLGYARVEVGTDRTQEAFLNVEVFQQLHYASISVADLTGLRANCLIELGYALGRQIPVILTAMRGTRLPFDPGAIPCHFWGGRDQEVEMKDFRQFWKANADRGPIVTSRGLLP